MRTAIGCAVPFAVGIIAHAWLVRAALAWAMVLSSIVRAALLGATSLASTGVCVFMSMIMIDIASPLLLLSIL